MDQGSMSNSGFGTLRESGTLDMDQGSINSGFGTLRESGTLVMDQGSVNSRVWNPKGVRDPKRIWDPKIEGICWILESQILDASTKVKMGLYRK